MTNLTVKYDNCVTKPRKTSLVCIRTKDIRKVKIALKHQVQMLIASDIWDNWFDSQSDLELDDPENMDELILLIVIVIFYLTENNDHCS